MNQLQQIITHLSEIEKIEEKVIIHRKPMRAVFLRCMAQWIAVRVFNIPEMEIRLFLNYQRDTSVTQNVQKIDQEIINQNFYKINYIITICKDLNLIPANPDGTSSPSDSFNTLLKYLPLELQSMAQTTGNTSTTDMTATKQLSSGTWSNTRTGRPSTKKADSPTSPTQRGTRSFLFTSDIAWAKRETYRNTNLTTRAEREMYYTALLRACEWGRKCDYENRKRKTELKDQNIYSSIID